MPEQTFILEGRRPIGFLDRLWEWGAFETNVNATQTIADDTLKLSDGTLQDLKAQLAGQTSPIDALQFVDKLIQAATRTETLHQNVDGNVQYPRYIQYGGFLRELTELGFEIMRVKPTTTAGVNEMSEWIENLLEEGGSGTGIRLAAGGLAQLFDGFKLNQSGSYSDPAGMAQMGQALDYMGRLVQVANAVDDVNLDQLVLKANVLSQFLNLGGTYAAISPQMSTGAIYAVLNNSTQNTGGSSDSLAVFLDSAYRGVGNATLLKNIFLAFPAYDNHLKFSSQSLKEYLKQINIDSRGGELRKFDYIQFFMEQNSTLGILAQGAGVFDRPRNPNQGPPPPDKCRQLLFDMLVQILGGITEQFPVRDTVIPKGLNQRYIHLRQDKEFLYRDYRSLNTPKPGIGSWQGHINAYEGLRGNLKKLITAWERENCDNHDGGLGVASKDEVKAGVSVVKVMADRLPPDMPDYEKQFRFPDLQLPNWEIPDWFFAIPAKVIEQLTRKA